MSQGVTACQHQYFFFYGSLMDPEVLQSVLSLPKPPTLRPARIRWFKQKMWGPYPTLVQTDNEDHVVIGVVHRVDSYIHHSRLESYETKAYNTRFCTIEVDDGNVYPLGWVFAWAGDPDSQDLEDGTLDIEWYQRIVKPSIVGRKAGSDGS
jgi:Gamma-glutamyl cyclotransferase, AIG2-like